MGEKLSHSCRANRNIITSYLLIQQYTRTYAENCAKQPDSESALKESYVLQGQGCDSPSLVENPTPPSVPYLFRISLSSQSTRRELGRETMATELEGGKTLPSLFASSPRSPVLADGPWTTLLGQLFGIRGCY